MPGGLLNLVSNVQQNIILNKTPSKTLFKRTYSKYSIGVIFNNLLYQLFF